MPGSYNSHLSIMQSNEWLREWQLENFNTLSIKKKKIWRTQKETKFKQYSQNMCNLKKKRLIYTIYPDSCIIFWLWICRSGGGGKQDQIFLVFPFWIQHSIKWTSIFKALDLEYSSQILPIILWKTHSEICYKFQNEIAVPNQ